MSAAPLVVQADRTVLLEVDHPRAEEARERLARFAELVKSPEHVHFYRIDAISIWNAAALGEPLDELEGWLIGASRYPVPASLIDEIRTWYRRYGALRLERLGGEQLALCGERALLDELREAAALAGFFAAAGDAAGDGAGAALPVPAADRGALKQALLDLGYPVDDRAGYRDGARLELALRDTAGAGERPFAVRPYQREAADAFWLDGASRGGCGVVVLPCGAGKTIVGLQVMALLRTQTLILTTSTTSVQQWRRELLDKTSLREDDIGEYTGERKEIRPVTITTYQILTYRRRKTDPFVHFGLFDGAEWGLIVYDEVHLLPAPVFRATAAIQARRRLGLTATLVREDGREEEVFSLIGPKRYDLPWRQLERSGWLATAHCHEVRVSFSDAARAVYEAATAREQIRLSGANERKVDVVGRLLAAHRDDRVLVIGQYLDQLRKLAALFDLPLITGRTPQAERERLYGDFRAGRIRHLMVSKVGNFAVDLPDANVAVQVSGTFGSRQEEAQRLGRILRPKPDGAAAAFYAVVTEDSRDQEFAARRQLFLCAQGYGYRIVPADHDELRRRAVQ